MNFIEKFTIIETARSNNYDGPEVSEFSTLKNQLKTLKNTVENSHGEKNQLKTLMEKKIS